MSDLKIYIFTISNHIFMNSRIVDSQYYVYLFINYRKVDSQY